VINLGILQAVLRMKDQMSGPLRNASAAVARASTIMAAAAAAAALAVGIALIKATREVLAYADALDNMSTATQIGVEKLQIYIAAAERAGQGAASIRTAIQRMQRSIGEGTAETDRAFANLNLSMSQLKALRPEEQFELILKRLGGIKDPAEKAANAMILFGRSGANLLSLTGDTLPKLEARMRELGIVIDQETIVAVDKLEEDIDLMSRTAQSAWRNLGAGIATSEALSGVVGLLTGELGGLNIAIRDNGAEIRWWVNFVIQSFANVVLKSGNMMSMLDANIQKATAAIRAAGRAPLEVLSGESPIANLAKEFAEIDRIAVNSRKVMEGWVDGLLVGAPEAAVALGEAVVAVAELETVTATLNTTQGLNETQLLAVDTNLKKMISSMSSTKTEALNLGTDLETFGVVVEGVGDLVEVEAAEMEAAFATFGLQTQAQLGATADKAVADFAIIKASGEKTADELKEIWEKAEKAKQTATGATKEFTLTQGAELAAGVAGQLAQLGGKFKVFALAEAVISTALSVARALAGPPPFPFSIPQAIAAGIAGAVQIATISSTGFQRGTPGLDFQDFGRESVVAVHGREAIIPEGGGNELASQIAASLAPQVSSTVRGLIPSGVIPSLAKGGFVPSPTLALVGDTPGGEFVTPARALGGGQPVVNVTNVFSGVVFADEFQFGEEVTRKVKEALIEGTRGINGAVRK